jgi:CubicO group peptidase (beta-lactamase class C family)
MNDRAAAADDWVRIPRTHAVLAGGRRDGLHIGAQLYVSRHGVVVADCAMGESRHGVPMTPDTLMIWFSSTKPVTAVALAQQWERGRCRPDDPVCQHVPEFAAAGKTGVTIRHLLTHTGGFRFADGFGTRRGPFAASWEENLARVCAAELEVGWEPGQRAGYHPTSSMFIVGEIVRRCDGRPFDRYVREEIFLPLGMRDSWIGMPTERFRAYGDRIGLMHNTEKKESKPLPGTDSEEVTARCIPGGNGRGPMRELGWFYEALLGDGARNGTRILSPQTVTALTARHRVGMHDATLGLVVDWGLGFAIDTVSYGRHASPRTFGHGGAQSSVGFADPEHGVVVTLVTNGMPGRDRHYRRFEAVCSALYEDLGIVPPGSAGRSHPMPAAGLT